MVPAKNLDVHWELIWVEPEGFNAKYTWICTKIFIVDALQAERGYEKLVATVLPF